MNEDRESVVIDNDFRVTRTRAGLRVEVLDYHVGALELTERVLVKLGFRPIRKTAPRTPHELESD